MNSRLTFSHNSLYIFLSILLMITSLVSRAYVPQGMDYMLFAILFLLTLLLKRPIYFPMKYMMCIVVLVSLCVVNFFISSYSPPIIYTLLALFITVVPFLTFCISYNYKFSKREIDDYIDVIINMALLIGIFVYIESLLFIRGAIQGIIGSRIFAFGFLAAFWGQTIILSLARYFRTHRRKYLFVATFFFISIVLSNQLKTMTTSLFTIAFFLIYLTDIKRSYKIMIITVGAMLLVLLLLFKGAFIIDKVVLYTNMYGSESAKDNIARVALYYQSIEIVKDHFPFGTGQGTFGSVPVNILYSDVYYDYGLAHIHGLAEYGEDNFRMDTHWASVLGELGLIGFIIYLFLFTFPMTRVRKMTKMNYMTQKAPREYLFIVYSSLPIIIIESIVLSIPTRFCFILLYAGLTAIIFRYLLSLNRV